MNLKAYFMNAVAIQHKEPTGVVWDRTIIDAARVDSTCFTSNLAEWLKQQSGVSLFGSPLEKKSTHSVWSRRWSHFKPKKKTNKQTNGVSIYDLKGP